MKATRILNKFILIALIINLTFAVILVFASPFLIVGLTAAYKVTSSTQVIETTEVINPNNTVSYVENIINTPQQIDYTPLPYFVLVIVVLEFIMLCYVFTSYHLFKFFKSINDGKYFDYYNGIRLRLMGLAYIIGSTTLMLYNNILVTVLSNSVSKLIPLSFNLPGLSSDFSGVMIGLMFIIIAQAFIQGNKLEQEDKLVI